MPGPTADIWRYYTGRSSKPQLEKNDRIHNKTTHTFINATKYTVSISLTAESGSIVYQPSQDLGPNGEGFYILGSDDPEEELRACVTPYVSEGDYGLGQPVLLKFPAPYFPLATFLQMTQYFSADKIQSVAEYREYNDWNFNEEHGSWGESDEPDPEDRTVDPNFQKPDKWYSDSIGPAYDKVIEVEERGRCITTAMKPKPHEFIVVMEYVPSTKSLEGKCLRTAGGDLCLIMDEMAHQIASQSVFNGMFGDNKEIEDFPRSHIARMEDGREITADRPLISVSGGGIFLLYGEVKRHIANMDTLNFYKFYTSRLVVDNNSYTNGPEIRRR